MKIAVIGSFVNDTLHPFREPIKKSLGGITYTIPYLANLAEPDWEILPLCVIGSDIQDQVNDLLSEYKNVNTAGIKVIDRENTRVTLVYSSKLVRDEFTTEPMPNIDRKQIEFAMDADVILINFITGDEISLKDLQYLAQNAKGFIYMDYHQLAWRIGKQSKRILWKREDWIEWVKVAKILQMNELEGGVLTGKSEEATIRDFTDFGHKIAKQFGSIVNITTGDRGSWLYYMDNKRFVSQRLQPSRKWAVCDPTGCGDAFASAFLIAYLNGNDPQKSAQYANSVAGFNCTFSGIQQLDELWGDFHHEIGNGTG